MDQQDNNQEPKSEEIITTPVDVSAGVDMSGQAVGSDASTPAPSATPQATSQPTPSQTTAAATNQQKPGASQKEELTEDKQPAINKDEKTVEYEKSMKKELRRRTVVDSSFYKVRRSVTEALRTSPKARTYTVIILTLVTVIFFVAVTIVPTISTIGKIQAEIREKKIVLADLEQNVATLETFSAAQISDSAKFEAISEAVPQDFELTLFSRNLTEIAKLYEVEFRDVSYQPEINSPDPDLTDEYRRIRVSTSFRGTMADLLKVLAHLERYNRIFSTTAVNFTRFDDPELPPYEMSVRGDIYISRPISVWEELMLNEQ